MKVAIGLIVALVAGAALWWSHNFGFTEAGKQQVIEREAIKICRTAEKDQLQELQTRRDMREYCDQLEAEFKARHE